MIHATVRTDEDIRVGDVVEGLTDRVRRAIGARRGRIVGVDKYNVIVEGARGATYWGIETFWRYFRRSER